MEDSLESLLKARQEMLLIDLAIHLETTPEEARARVQPLVEAGLVAWIWQPRKTTGCVLCGCDRDEYVRWLDTTSDAP